MKLTMTTSLGTKDAKLFDLDPAGLREGATVDVDGQAAEELIKRGWAVQTTAAPSPIQTAALDQPPKPAPAKVKTDA